MTSKDIFGIIKKLSESSPLIHCITNPISITLCANAILALNCCPMMAEHPKETREITESADSLLLNLGNITDARMEAMPISASCAERKGIPCVLDLVGVACSHLRREFALSLMENTAFFVIKGNYSEIYAVFDKAYSSRGVDADVALTVKAMDDICAQTARRYGCIVMASGKIDIVTDGKVLFHIANGTERLASITGTGCMLGAITACFLAARRDIVSVAAACALLGICGECAQNEKGNASFAASVLDNLSNISENDIEKLIRTEEKHLEI